MSGSVAGSPQGDGPQGRESRLGAAVYASAALGALFVVPIGLRALTIGSRDGGWVFPYVQAFTERPVLSFFLVLPYAVLLTRWAGRRLETSEARVLLGWFAAALPLQLVLHWAYPVELGRLVQSDQANSFYSIALRLGAADLLQRYETLLAVGGLPLHAQANLPGKVLFYQALTWFVRDPQALGVLVLALSNLAAPLVYWLTRELSGSRRAGLYAAILVLFLPGRIQFAPLLNVVSPVLMLLLWAVALRGLRSGSLGLAAGFGFVVFCILLFEPMLLATAPLGAALLAACRGDLRARRVAAQLAVAAAVVAAASVALRLGYGYDLAAGLRRAAEHQVRFNAHAGRSYGVWLWANLVELAVSMGPALLLLTIFAALRPPRGASAMRWLAASVLAALVLLDGSGIARGEVARLWIFLGTLFAIAPAVVCSRAEGERPFLALLAAQLLLASVSCGMVGFVLP